MVASLNHANSVLAAYSNPPDYWEWQVWSSVLKPGDFFVDVGANVGLYSLLAAEAGCRVLAFEPDDDNRSELMRNIAINQREDVVTVVPKAVSDQYDSVAFLAGRDALARITSVRSEDVVHIPCTTLDAEIGNQQVAGLKIDVEGAEASVLQGALGLLKSQAIDLIQIECNQMSQMNFGLSRDDTSAILTSCGYKPLSFTPEGGDWGPEGQVNHFWVPSASPFNSPRNSY